MTRSITAPTRHYMLDLDWHALWPPQCDPNSSPEVRKDPAIGAVDPVTAKHPNHLRRRVPALTPTGRSPSTWNARLKSATSGHKVRPEDGKARTRHACAVPVASHYRNTPHRVRQQTGDIGAGTPTGHLHRLPLGLRRRRGVEQLTENVKMGRKDRFKYADARTRTHSVTLFLSCGYSPTHTRTPIKSYRRRAHAQPHSDPFIPVHLCPHT